MTQPTVRYPSLAYDSDQWSNHATWKVWYWLVTDEEAFIPGTEAVDLADLLAASRAEAHEDWCRNHDLSEDTAALSNFAGSLECAVREHIPGAENVNQPENLYSDILDDALAHVAWFDIATRIAYAIDHRSKQTARFHRLNATGRAIELALRELGDDHADVDNRLYDLLIAASNLHGEIIDRIADYQVDFGHGKEQS